MKRKFYKEGDTYLMSTGTSPKEFKDVLFIVWAGEIDSLREEVRTADQLKQLKEVEVDEEWENAFAKAAGFDPLPRKAKIEEFVAHTAVGTDMFTAAVVSGLVDAPRAPQTPQTPQTPESYETFQNTLVAICMLSSALIYLLFSI